MGVLNFNTDKLITGVNIIDGNLYWTDDNSEPKKLEIDVFRDYDHSGPSTRTGDNYVIESDLSVIRLHPWKPITLDLEEYTSTATQPEPPFESIFPRFSYRWRFEDGQYSPYAPFTQAAFIPETRTADSDEENYTEGFNTTLYNNVGTINLNNIPRGPRDVVAVQLLYTESISATIYTLETIDIPEAQRGLDYILSGSYVDGVPQMPDDYTLLPLSYSLSARKIYSALPGNQLNRPYDEVPQRALAQEITANRLIYGNYQIGFDQPDALQLTSELVSAGTGDGLHVKGNRTYEIGVAYIDAYGRQGSMVTAGSITAEDGSITEQIPLTSNFAQTTREQIEVTITSDPPSWADRYRYFIKDPSMDHHNLISYNIYNEGSATDNASEHVWIEFQSTDRNKVFDNTSAVDGSPGTVLVLRRSGSTVEQTKQRFLVQDIENEAPDEVRNQLAATDVNTTARSAGYISSSQFDTVTSGSNFNRPSTVAAGATQYFLRDKNTGGSATSLLNQLLNTFNGWINDNQPTGDNADIELLELVQSGEPAITADLTLGERPLLVEIKDHDGDIVGGEGALVQIESVISQHLPGSTQDDDHLITINFGDQWSLDEDTEVLTKLSTSGLPGSVSTGGTDNDPSFRLYSTVLSDEALERLQGRFWVRAARNGLTTVQSSFDDQGEIVTLQPHWFETEPAVAESQLDLFWESSETFCICTQHGWANKLDWFNCVAEVENGVYLESTRINDKFNTVQLVRGVRANIPTDRNEIIERPYGLTWSGIYNSRTSVNRLNQFITEDGITKELEPNYGSLQKLHTRDTNLIALCEDKVFRIQADKDVLFNANGGGNVTASNNVLGQTIPVIGEYGISTNPESFASYGHNVWFSDAKRGAMMQYTPNNGQLFEISKRGMDDFFRDRLFSANKIIGMFDDYTDAYIVSVQGYDPNDSIISEDDKLPFEKLIEEPDRANVTLKYETSVEGWPSFLSYIPEMGATLNNKFFTWKDGQMYMHNSNTADRNTFYGTYTDSEMQLIFNDQPSAVKEFLTLNWEGDNDWVVTSIDTESNDTEITTLPLSQKTREGKHFIPITSNVPATYVLDPTGPYEGSDGNMYAGVGTKLKSGIKGFYANVRLTNNSTEPRELFSVATENFISSN